eukprot:1610126-Alexandrium_andersonii.AAC.1
MRGVYATFSVDRDTGKQLAACSGRLGIAFSSCFRGDSEGLVKDREDYQVVWLPWVKKIGTDL